MTEADRKPFGVAMGLVAEVYESALTVTRIQVYWESLIGWELTEVENAMRESIKTCEFFPRPATLIRILREQRSAARRALGPARLALPEPALTNEEAKGFLETLRNRIMAFVSQKSPASRRSLQEIEAEAERLRRLPPDPQHEQRKREVLERFKAVVQ